MSNENPTTPCRALEIDHRTGRFFALATDADSAPAMVEALRERARQSGAIREYFIVAPAREGAP